STILAAEFAATNSLRLDPSMLPPCNEAPWPSHVYATTIFKRSAVPACGARLASLLPLRLVTDLLDLDLERLVLAHLCLQKLYGDFGLCLDTARRQQIHVGRFIAAVGEVSGLDPAALDQSSQAVVHLTEADSELARNISLAHLGVGLEQSHQLVADAVRDRRHPVRPRDLAI